MVSSGSRGPTAPPGPPSAALRAYGGKRRTRSRSFHLRFEGQGARLIVDGTLVVSLNIEAAFIADLVLRGADDERIEREIPKSFFRRDRGAARRDVSAVRDMIDGLERDGSRFAIEQDRGLPCLSLGGMEDILEPEAPFRADLALTYDCNNRCRHCYAGGEGRPDALPAARWKEIIRKLMDIGVPYICFTGGEPTMFEGLEELVRYASELGLVTGVLTNGRRFSDKEFTARLAAAGLDYVQATLESADERIHDYMVGGPAWKQTVEGISNCIGAGLYVVTNTTLTQWNAEGAGKTAALSASLGVGSIAANTLIRTGRTRRRNIPSLPWDALYCAVSDMQEEAHREGIGFLWYTPTPYCRFNPFSLELGLKRCSAASGSVAVDPSGCVLPCQSFFVPAGNLLHQRWEDIRSGPVFSAVRAWRSERFACADCPDRDLCRGGCPLDEELDLRLAPRGAARGAGPQKAGGHARTAS